MKTSRALAVALLLFLPATAFPRQKDAPPDLVNRAVQALGGAGAMGELKGLRYRAVAKHWEPEQSLVPDGEMRLAGDSVVTVTRDLSGGAARLEWTRHLVYPSEREYRFTELVSGGRGYVQGVDSTSRTKQSLDADPPAHTMSNLRVAAALRELKRSSPLLLLEMQRNPGRLSAAPGQRAGGRLYPAVRYDAPEYPFVVLFDPGTGLPVRVRTLDADALYGDSAFDLVLGGWRSVDGVRIASEQRYELQGRKVAEMNLQDLEGNPPLTPALFEFPGSGPAAAASAPRRAAIPFQWVIRRQWLGTYLDTDAVTHDPAASPGLRLVDLAPGVSQLVGGTHNSLVVDAGPYLVVFDAPIGEVQSRVTIDAARGKYPGKPIKYLVLTHHHMDHTSGARAFVAEGAAVVVGKVAGDHFRKVLRAPHTIDGDALQKKGRRGGVIEVAERWGAPGATRAVEALAIENPHSEAMLIGYVPEARIGFVTDLWSPGRDKLGDKPTPGQAAVVAAVKKWRLTPETFAGGHGSTGKYAELEAIAGAGR